MRIRQVFAKNLKRMRKEKGLSQEKLAHMAGLERSYIGSLERCEYNTTIEIADKIAKALGTDASTLLQ